MSCFIGGLRTNICHIVQMFKPITLAATVGLARLRYDELAANCPNHWPLSSQLLPPPTAPHPLTTSKTLTRSRPTSIPIKWLTPVEMKVTHNKVLCYKCHVQFKPRHCCKQQMFFLLDVEVPGDVEDEALMWSRISWDLGPSSIWAFVTADYLGIWTTIDWNPHRFGQHSQFHWSNYCQTHWLPYACKGMS